MHEVVLVSGLWVPAMAMGFIAGRLARAGFAPARFAYLGREPIEKNVERFARFVRSRAWNGAPHFVGHSLGGVLVFDMLSACPDIPAGRVVLVGAPVRGSLAGRRLGSYAPGRWMLGCSVTRWTERDATWRRPEALGVIAGTLPVGLGRLLGRLPGDNDGVVRVEETTVTGMADRALLRQAHSQLAFSGGAATLIERFLVRGRFA